ncbi:hypothetical protein Pmar_PMAR018994, partial [Perkinsus marinus ATCC 50983]
SRRPSIIRRNDATSGLGHFYFEANFGKDTTTKRNEALWNPPTAVAKAIYRDDRV